MKYIENTTYNIDREPELQKIFIIPPKGQHFKAIIYLSKPMGFKD